MNYCPTCITHYTTTYEEHCRIPLHSKIEGLEKQNQELRIEGNLKTLSRMMREIESLKTDLSDVIDMLKEKIDAVIEIQIKRIEKLNKE